jgi:hypothetical protein
VCKRRSQTEEEQGLPCRREEKAVTAGTLLGAALELRIYFVAPLVPEGREGEA